MHIPVEEVQFHPSSSSDHKGRLFMWRNGLYRALTPKGAPISRELFDAGLAEQLVAQGLLVETEETDLVLDGYAAVLKHRSLPFVSFPFEWSFEQLRDAALLVADLELELIRSGLTLFDSGPWNVLFDGARPVYVDFCSITKDHRHVQWPGLVDFTRKFVYPLHLMARGHDHVARWLLHDRVNGVLDSEFAALAGWRGASRRVRTSAADLRLRGERWRARRLTMDARIARERTARRRLVRRLRSEVESIPSPTRRSSEVTPATSSLVRDAVNTIFVERRPESVLHLLREATWCPILSAGLGIPTVTLTEDGGTTGSLYEHARRNRLPLLPLTLDLDSPSPGLGVANKELPAADVRLRSEMVVAVDVIPTLVDDHAMTWDQVSSALAAFTGRTLVVAVPDAVAPGLGDLTGALSREFRDVSSRRIDSTVLVVCER